MTDPLTRTERQLDSRFRLLEQKLNDDLGFRDQRLRFAKIPDRSGVTTWQLRNNSRTEVEESAIPRVACQLAVSQEDAAAIHIAFHEQWVSAGRQVGLRFKASNLRFVVVTTNPTGTPLQFRLEWAGRDYDGGGVLVYPGQGAAHPHWQFDVDASWYADDAPQDAQVDLDPEAPEFETVDLTADVTEALSATEEESAFRWFHKLHLPARAMWHEMVCVMPTEVAVQQHEPKSVDELDQWIRSALRYMRHEFSIYS